MIFQIDDFDVEEIIKDKPSAKDGEPFLNEILKGINEQDLSEEALSKISKKFKIRFVYKISKDGQNVGEITFREEKSKPVIGIEIEEQFRNQGIGYKVLKELIVRQSTTNDIKYFVCSVRNDNIPSIRLVEKLGGIRVKTFQLFEHNDLAIFTYHIPVKKQ